MRLGLLVTVVTLFTLTILADLTTSNFHGVARTGPVSGRAGARRDGRVGLPHLARWPEAVEFATGLTRKYLARRTMGCVLNRVGTLQISTSGGASCFLSVDVLWRNRKSNFQRAL